MARGDHIYVRRRGYTHHGIDIGQGRVIHYSGQAGRGKADASIREASLEEFAGGGRVEVRRYGKRFDIESTVARAKSKLGECDYNLFGQNCEHFVTWCVTGRSASAQMNGALATASVGTATGAAAAGSVGIVSAAGVVAGVSGPGVMSGLATLGGLVGGGAVAGLATLGAAPGLASVAVMHVALGDSDALAEDERKSRRYGRHASAVGAAGGTVAGIGAVSVAGTAGLSAAGITSGLAAVGGAVGGGMVAGTAVVVAAPAVGAALLGYTTYRVVRRLRRQSDSADNT